MKLYKYALALSIAGFIFALDQISKIYIHTEMQVGDRKDVVEGFFSITYVRNPGGIFGLFKESPDYIRYFLFFIFPVVAIFIIFKFLAQTQLRHQIISFGMILGGAIGNYFDRIRLDYVIDFIDWHIKDVFHWPIFNVADISIVTGVATLCLSYYFLEKKSI